MKETDFTIYGNKEKIQVLAEQQRTNLADVHSKEARTSSDSYYLDSVDNILQSFGDGKDIYTKDFPKYAEQMENTFGKELFEKIKNKQELSFSESQKLYPNIVDLSEEFGNQAPSEKEVLEKLRSMVGEIYATSTDGKSLRIPQGRDKLSHIFKGDNYKRDFRKKRELNRKLAYNAEKIIGNALFTEAELPKPEKNKDYLLGMHNYEVPVFVNGHGFLVRLEGEVIKKLSTSAPGSIPVQKNTSIESNIDNNELLLKLQATEVSNLYVIRKQKVLFQKGKMIYGNKEKSQENQYAALLMAQGLDSLDSNKILHQTNSLVNKTTSTLVIDSNQAARIKAAREIKENMPNLSENERTAAIAILEAGAKSQGVEFSEYVEKTFPDGIFGDIKKAENAAKQQGVNINGAVSVNGFGENVKAVIYAGKNADFSTWCHELSHIWQAQLAGELKNDAEEAFQVKDSDWQNSIYTFKDGHTDTSAEAFAYGFEDFLKNKAGEMAAEDKKKIFEKFADYMSRTYNGIKQRIEINEKIASVYQKFVELDDNILAQAEKAVRLEIEQEQKINEIFNSPNFKTSQKVSETIGLVSDKFAALASQYRYDIKGYSHTIDNFFVNHALKQHGDKETEEKRGNVAITYSDICNVFSVYTHPDYIVFGTKTKTGNPAIVYVKNIGDSTIFVEDVRRGKKELAAQTLYKKSGTIDVSSKKEAPELYAHSDPESISIVDVKKEFVNESKNEFLQREKKIAQVESFQTHSPSNQNNSTDAKNANISFQPVDDSYTLFQSAYHGSSANFDKFNTSEYGLSGDGAMAFGYGVYVSNSETIARSYAGIQGERNLYTVEIPDGDYIIWNKTVSKLQKEKVKNELYENLIKEDYKGVEKQISTELNNVFSEEFDGKKLYGTISSYIGSDKETSRFFKNIGYSGIQYPAGTPENAVNYVIFDDNDIKIKNHFQFQIIGELGARELDRNAESNERIANLETAKRMEEAEKDSNAIRLATGWEKGADGKWKYEIDDSKVHFNLYDAMEEWDEMHPRYEELREKFFKTELTEEEQKEFYQWADERNEVSDKHTDMDFSEKLFGKTFRLPEVMRHNELFKAYPELKYVTVSIKKTGENGTLGNASYEDKHINLYRHEKDTDGFEEWEKKAGSVLIHEVQHIIQGIEGFAKGASPEMFEESPEASEQSSIGRKIVADGKSFMSAMEAYRASAGEVESRNVQTRMRFTPKQRINTLLSDTADIAPKDQIVMFDVPTSESRDIKNTNEERSVALKADSQENKMGNISATMKSATKDFMDLNATPITEERIDFLKTPTGNKSELSENEWKFSHSSEFKKLYGDWEGKIKKDFLLNDDTVSKLTGDEFSRKEGFTLTEQVEQYFNEMNNSVESPFFGKVVLDREGADDSLSHGMGRLKAVAYAGVPNVIKNGVIIDSDLNHKDRGYNSYVIAAPIKIADKNYICEVVLKQNKQENRFYLHEVTEQKKFLERAFVTNPAQKPAHQGTLSNILEKTVSVNYEISCPMGINGEPEKTFVQNEYRKSLDEFQSKNQNTAAKITGSVSQEENPFKNADPDQTKELYEQAEAVEKMQQEAAANAVLDENGNTHYQTDEELLQEYKQKYPESSLSISEDTRNELENVFSQIDDYLDKGIVPQERRFTLPKVSSYLKQLGSDETAISLPVSVIKKARETHGLSNEEIKNSLTRLYDPVAVFDTDKTKSENKLDSKLILTDEFSESKPIALALNTNTQIQVEENGHRKFIEVQDIRSIHDRTLTAKNGTDLVKHWTENGLCRYVDDKKISEWSTVARVSFPIEALHSDKNNILTKSEVVNPTRDDRLSTISVPLNKEYNENFALSTVEKLLETEKNVQKATAADFQQIEPALQKKFDKLKAAIKSREEQDIQDISAAEEPGNKKKAIRSKSDIIRQAGKDFLKSVKEGIAPFFNAEDDFQRIIMHPQAIINASNGLPFSGESQLLAQIYHQRQRMEGEVVTSIAGAKAAGTIVLDTPESRQKNFALTDTSSLAEKNAIVRTRYFMPESCEEPDKIYAHTLQRQRPDKIRSYRDLIRHFENIPNGQKEISDIRIRIAHEHLKEIQSRFAIKEKRVLSVDEIEERKNFLRNYFERLPADYRNSERSAFEDTFGIQLNSEKNLEINLQRDFKDIDFAELKKNTKKSIELENRKLSDFIEKNTMEDKKLATLLSDEYKSLSKEEKMTVRNLKIEAIGIKEPETFLGKYLAACNTNAEFITDKETVEEVKKNLVKKLEENFKLEKYDILKEIGQQAQSIGNETTKKISFEKAHSNNKSLEKTQSPDKEISLIGMGK